MESDICSFVPPNLPWTTGHTVGRTMEELWVRHKLHFLKGRKWATLATSVFLVLRAMTCKAVKNGKVGTF